MNTLTHTANGFDLSAFSGQELQELFEAIENELERRQDELEQAKYKVMIKNDVEWKVKKPEYKFVEPEKKVQPIAEPLEQLDQPHYDDGRHQSPKIVWLSKVRTEGIDFSDVDMDKVDKLAKIYSRDNGNTIPMIIESTGYEDCELYYQLLDVGQSKTIYMALKKVYEATQRPSFASFAIVRKGKCYMTAHEANGKMDDDITSEYELLM